MSTVQVPQNTNMPAPSSSNSTSSAVAALQTSPISITAQNAGNTNATRRPLSFPQPVLDTRATVDEIVQLAMHAFKSKLGSVRIRNGLSPSHAARLKELVKDVVHLEAPLNPPTSYKSSGSKKVEEKGKGRFRHPRTIPPPDLQKRPLNPFKVEINRNSLPRDESSAKKRLCVTVEDVAMTEEEETRTAAPEPMETDIPKMEHSYHAAYVKRQSMQNVQHNHYHVLGVNHNAQQQHIRNAYFKIRKDWENDASLDVNAAVILELASNAYNVLRSRSRRDVFNRMLRSGAIQSPQPTEWKQFLTSSNGKYNSLSP